MTPSGPVAAIVLAAGASTRLGAGRSKQLLRYQGRTLLRHSVEQALASSCRPVIVVLGAEVERCQRELAGLDVHVAINPAWADGMGSSIRAGMTALTAAAPGARAVVITLCDQPLVGAAFIDRLVQRFRLEAAESGEPPESGEAADREVADGSRRWPPNMTGDPASRHCFRVRGSRSCRASTARPARGTCCVRLPRNAYAQARVVTLPCPEAAVDVDTITDYEALPQ